MITTPQRLTLVAAVSLAAALLPLAATAQTTPAATASDTVTTTTRDNVVPEEHHNYGWVGLLGLLGLAGLMPKKRVDTFVDRRDDGRTPTPGERRSTTPL